ncbi:hypothetical protein OG21DRAFT_1521480 [Imleria badia]|nr:hypothetical protein OG21DRAFT_1521480 [Imleria badia]
MSEPLQFLNELLISQFLVLAGDTILTYDYLLTFGLEMDYIWSAPWTTVKVLFLLNRYGTLISQIFLTLQQLGILNHGSRTKQLGLCFSYAHGRSGGAVVMLPSPWCLSMLSTCWRKAGIYPTLFSNILQTFPSVIWKRPASVSFIQVWTAGVLSLQALQRVGIAPGFATDSSSAARRFAPDDPNSVQVNIFYDVLDILSILVPTRLEVPPQGPLYLIQTEFSFPLLIIAGQRAVLNLRGFQSQSFRTPFCARTNRSNATSFVLAIRRPLDTRFPLDHAKGGWHCSSESTRLLGVTRGVPGPSGQAWRLNALPRAEKPIMHAANGSPTIQMVHTLSNESKQLSRASNGLPCV